MIWGLTLEPGKVYTEVIQDEVQLSMATLESRKEASEDEKVRNFSHIVMATENAQYLLCTLVNGATYQQTLDLRIMPQEKVTFSVEGTNTVYLMGYSTVYPGANQDFLPSDEEVLSGWDEDPTSANDREMAASDGLDDGSNPGDGVVLQATGEAEDSSQSGDPGGMGAAVTDGQGFGSDGTEQGTEVKDEPMSPQAVTIGFTGQHQEMEKANWPRDVQPQAAGEPSQALVGLSSSHDQTGFMATSDSSIIPGPMGEEPEPIIVASPHQDSDNQIPIWAYGGGHGSAIPGQDNQANFSTQGTELEASLSMQFQPPMNTEQQIGTMVDYHSDPTRNLPRNSRGRGYQNVRGLHTPGRSRGRGRSPRGAPGRGAGSRGLVKRPGRPPTSSLPHTQMIKVEPGIGVTLPSTSMNAAAGTMAIGATGTPDTVATANLRFGSGSNTAEGKGRTSETPDRKHICSTCGRVFLNLHHLRRHELIHSGEKPFNCPICPVAFRRNDTLLRHMRSHHSQAYQYFKNLSPKK